MLIVRAPLSWIALILACAFAITALPAGATDSECHFRCEQTVDTAQCVEAARMGSADCQIASACMIYAYDPDGPGPQAPIIRVECQYFCNMNYCVWV